MSKLSDNKLSKLKSLDSQGGFWYITKQNLIFRDLCFMAKILETWNDRKEENYQSFFDRYKTLPDYGALTSDLAHRATKNCEYIGLTVPSDKYSAQNLTPFYFALSKMCDGDFNKLSSYPQIVDKQLERMYIDSQTSNVYSVNFKICPFMFLFKVLLLLGDITKSFKITKAEFKLFVATAQTWSEYFEVVESILRYRNDAEYRAECDKNNNKVSDSRYQVLAQNHSQLEVDGNNISIKDSEIRNVRRKVAEYELSDKIQSAEDIFEPMTGVSSNEKGDVDSLYTPYLTALRTKPFMLLAGISGTGKSRIVRELAFKSCPEFLRDADGTTPGNYCMIEVKPNWHDSSELLGYYSHISKEYQYTNFIKFLVKAMMFPDVPFFVCLDEMNLAPVEQYFAEFLSVLETRKKVGDRIHTGALVKPEYFKELQNAEGGDGYIFTQWFPEIKRNIPYNIYTNPTLAQVGLTLPDNVFIIGTVNMDDTTHQFSRKVLDRAMTIEMNGGKLSDMFGQSHNLEYLPEEDIWDVNKFIPEYVTADEVIAVNPDTAEELKTKLPERLEEINEVLKDTPFVVSYRVLNELVIYTGNLLNDGKSIDEAIDEAVNQIVLMKILPRIEGDEDMFIVKGAAENRLEQLAHLVSGATKAKLEEMNNRLSTGFTRFWP